MQFFTKEGLGVLSPTLLQVPFPASLPTFKVWFGSKEIINLLSVVQVYSFFIFFLQCNTFSLHVLVLVPFLLIKKHLLDEFLLIITQYFILHFSTVYAQKTDICSPMQYSPANAE